jgi:hypothetical protein
MHDCPRQASGQCGLDFVIAKRGIFIMPSWRIVDGTHPDRALEWDAVPGRLRLDVHRPSPFLATFVPQCPWSPPMLTTRWSIVLSALVSALCANTLEAATYRSWTEARQAVKASGYEEP